MLITALTFLSGNKALHMKPQKCHQHPRCESPESDHGAETTDGLLRHNEAVQPSFLVSPLPRPPQDFRDIRERLKTALDNNAPDGRTPAPRDAVQMITFRSPSDICSLKQDPENRLVGDAHIERGEVIVIGGEPGAGKSTLALDLAFSGATGRPWLGLPVHRKFRTLIIQSENGLRRLRADFSARGMTKDLDDWIRVSEPPPFGLPISDPQFQNDIKREISVFPPDAVLVDPWNAVAKDISAAEYSMAFSQLRSLIMHGNMRPALVISAHTRKPRPGEQKAGGTALMHMLAGSYVLTSVPRSIFIVVRANAADETDSSVVVFNPKNNNGEKAERSAWRCTPSGYRAIPDFDWEAFDEGSASRRVIEIDDIADVLGDGILDRAQAINALSEKTGFGRRACEKALSKNGRFAESLIFDGSHVGLSASDNDTVL
jgi:hypothetical protein